MNDTHRPPESIPAELVEKYTMGSRIPITYRYLDGTRGRNEELVYTSDTIDKYIAELSAERMFYYGRTDRWLKESLSQFSVSGMEVAVMGSVEPLYESCVIFHGGKPTTIEYNRIVSNDPRLNTLTVDDFKRAPCRFDAALSISSFEHDGLGRYGDPVDPDGDLKAMSEMRSIVKPDGLLFLAVPVGPDTLVWNAHRIYGALRLPKLLDGWSLVACFPSRLWLSGLRDESQPIFVLKNRPGDNVAIRAFAGRLQRALALKRPVSLGWRVAKKGLRATKHIGVLGR